MEVRFIDEIKGYGAFAAEDIQESQCHLLRRQPSPSSQPQNNKAAGNSNNMGCCCGQPKEEQNAVSPNSYSDTSSFLLSNYFITENEREENDDDHEERVAELPEVCMQELISKEMGEIDCCATCLRHLVTPSQELRRWIRVLEGNSNIDGERRKTELRDEVALGGQEQHVPSTKGGSKIKDDEEPTDENDAKGNKKAVKRSTTAEEEEGEKKCESSDVKYKIPLRFVTDDRLTRQQSENLGFSSPSSIVICKSMQCCPPRLEKKKDGKAEAAREEKAHNNNDGRSIVVHYPRFCCEACHQRYNLRGLLAGSADVSLTNLSPSSSSCSAAPSLSSLEDDDVLDSTSLLSSCLFFPSTAKDVLNWERRRKEERGNSNDPAKGRGVIDDDDPIENLHPVWVFSVLAHLSQTFNDRIVMMVHVLQSLRHLQQRKKSQKKNTEESLSALLSDFLVGYAEGRMPKLNEEKRALLRLTYHLMKRLFYFRSSSDKKKKEEEEKEKGSTSREIVEGRKQKSNAGGADHRDEECEEGMEEKEKSGEKRLDGEEKAAEDFFTLQQLYLLQCVFDANMHQVIIVSPLWAWANLETLGAEQERSKFLGGRGEAKEENGRSKKYCDEHHHGDVNLKQHEKLQSAATSTGGPSNWRLPVGCLLSLYDMFPQLAQSQLHNFSVALFRYCSKINHSCSPNVKMLPTTAPCRAVMSAMKGIPKGSELHISYIDLTTSSTSACVQHFKTSPPLSLTSQKEEEEDKKQRMMELRDNVVMRRLYLSQAYGFHCECELCQQQLQGARE